MRARDAQRYLIIDSIAQLEEFTGRIGRERMIGVDLEADSMYHFREKVCLIQIASARVTAIIDPLQIKDLSVLAPLFRRADIQKVFHGADYDVRSLYRDFRIAVNNLFDTELACRFLGFKESGLNAVLNKKYNIQLDKKNQRKDWSKRPLPEDMVAYAAKDVHYLIPLAKSLQQELIQKGRLAWVQEECNHLSGVRPAPADSNPLFLGFKGAGRLSPKGLAVLEELLQLRRKIARRQDRPLFKIIGNQSILMLAEARPQSLKKLLKTGALGSKQAERYGKDIIAAVKKALQRPAKDLPKYPRKIAPIAPAIVARRVSELRNWRDQLAKKLQIDPAIICTRAQISAIAVQRPENLDRLSKNYDLKAWQVAEFGNQIVDILKKVG
jgi:ribonuclease D